MIYILNNNKYLKSPILIYYYVNMISVYSNVNNDELNVAVILNNSSLISLKYDSFYAIYYSHWLLGYQHIYMIRFFYYPSYLSFSTVCSII